MGVHGLTTFLRENKSVLSKTIHFSANDALGTPFVVDGWSFIYKVLEDSKLPWVYGGEYGAYADLVTKIVKAWLGLGLRLIFVFDGSIPPQKLNTAENRLNESFVQNLLIFFRTSAASRNSHRFLNETRIIPPMTHAACVHALQTLEDEGAEIEIHFADEEADPYAVELAGRVGGYVLGRDSDFVVLNSDGYLGYIPLEEMVWISLDDEAMQHTDTEPDDGFQTVKVKKKKSTSSRATGLGVIPPNSENLFLSVSLYTPAVLARHLNLPVSLLPLLGALVGNDYTIPAGERRSSATSPRAFQSLLFSRRLGYSKRITHASNTLNVLLHGQPGKRKQKRPQSVLELIRLTVEALLLSSGAPTVLIGAEQQAIIIERIVEGTLPYAIAPQPMEDTFLCDTVCALHLPHECRLVMQMDRAGIEDSSNYAVSLSALYLRAYRLGKFSRSLMDILSTRTFWPKISLENPDTENVGRSVSRYVREFGYALLEQGIGIPSPLINDRDEEAEEEAMTNSDIEDPEELIDVIEDSEEEYDDDLSADVGKLRGALMGLQFEEDEHIGNDSLVDNESSLAGDGSIQGSTAPASSIRSPIPLHPPSYMRRPIRTQRKIITEYVRRGTRVAQEEIVVRSLQHFDSLSESGEAKQLPIPIQLRSEEERIDVLCRFLRIDPQVIPTLSENDRLPVLALRFVVWRMHERAQESAHSKEKQLERWTRMEARAFLASIANNLASIANPTSQLSLDPPIEVSERSIQLTAQISTALESIGHVVQILLLTDEIPSCAHRFSGRRFHSLLASEREADVSEDIWRSLARGVEDCFTEERKGKKAKRKAQKVSSNVNTTPSSGGKMARTGSIYSLLADMSA